MKKLIMIVMCAAMILSLAACAAEHEPVSTGKQETAAAEAETEASSAEETPALGMGGQMQIANPFVACENMEEAAELAGFSLKIPDQMPDWISSTEIQVMDASMIEVICSDGSNRQLRIRKAPGSDDISGDYETYDNVSEIAAGGHSLTAKGKGDTFSTAVWTAGEYSYSVSSDEGLSQEDLISLASAIK